MYKILKVYLLSKSLINELNCLKKNESLYSKKNESTEDAIGYNQNMLYINLSETNGSFRICIFVKFISEFIPH
jgi:hypothetical protein